MGGCANTCRHPAMNHRASVCRIVNLSKAEYHVVDANNLPPDMVKPGPVLVA